MPSWVGRLTLVRGWQGWLSATAVSSGKRFAGIDSHKMLFETPSCLNGSCWSARVCGSYQGVWSLGDQVIWFWDITRLVTHYFGRWFQWSRETHHLTAPWVPASQAFPFLPRKLTISQWVKSVIWSALLPMELQVSNMKLLFFVFFEWWNFGFEEAENPKFRNVFFLLFWNSHCFFNHKLTRRRGWKVFHGFLGIKSSHKVGKSTPKNGWWSNSLGKLPGGLECG